SGSPSAALRHGGPAAERHHRHQSYSTRLEPPGGGGGGARRSEEVVEEEVVEEEEEEEEDVQLKKCIPFPMAQAFQAARAVLWRLLARPRSGLGPYHLRTLLFWACDRLPGSYLSRSGPEAPGRLLLGLLDDLAHCALSKSCPNYFLPQCNMLEHLTDGQALLAARKLAHLRADPAEHLRAALDRARQAGRLKKEALAGAGGGADGSAGSPERPEPPPANGIIAPREDKLAQRLQQLVTENPGKSISVFLNPDDVSRPHFRIDDKFY
ncbi:hypothetical protein CRUP_023892, partial [Coryphaenoides rupestris]